MTGLVGWGNFGLAAHRFMLDAGWVLFWIGIVLYYVATLVYAGDVVRGVRHATGGAGRSA